MKVRTILCPVDFFPASIRAAEYATALAKVYSARLILLHVIEPTGSWVYELPEDNELMKVIQKRAGARLAKLEKTARAANVPVKILLRTGLVDFNIRLAVSESKVDLVVMGTHGRRGLGKFLLGSTTERLLRKLHVPVLTIRDARFEVAQPIRNILLTTDFSEGTTDAVAYALSLADSLGAQLTLLHVLNDVQADISGIYRDSLIHSIQLQLQELLPAHARKARRITTRVLVGRPIRRILSLLTKEKIDLIVMNIHGKTFIDRISLGSTAEKIVRAVDVPVLAIPFIAKTRRRRTRTRKAA